MKEIDLTNQTNQSTQSSNNKKVIAVVVAVVIFALVVAVIVIVASSGGTKTHLTYDNYTAIETGMTYNQVVRVLENHEGELSSSSAYGDYSLAYYTWSNDSGTRCIVVGFQNGEVCVKTQYGLD